MKFYPICSLAASIICLFLGVIIYTRSKGNEKRKSFARVTILIGVWTLFPFVSSLPLSYDRIVLLVRVVYIPAIFVPSTFLSFMTYVMNIERDKVVTTILKSSYMVSLGFLIFNFSPLFINGVSRFMPGFAVIPGPIYVVFMLYFGLMYSYASFRFVKIYKHSTGYFRSQLKYVGLAFAIVFIGGLVHFLSAFHVKELFPHDILVAAYSLIMAYAIIRYRLMDINLAITRAVIFTLVYAVVLGIPFGLMGAGKPWLIQAFGDGWFWMPMLILLVLASLGPYLYLKLQRHAEGTLFRDQHKYQEILRSLSKEMAHVKDLARLVELIVHVLTKTMRITYAGIYLYDEKKKAFVLASHRGKKVTLKAKEIGEDNPLIKGLSQTRKPTVLEEIKHYLSLISVEENEIRRAVSHMQAMNATLIIPTYAKGAISTFLVLGDKISGRIYTADDLNTLSVLASQAALAIENAQFLKERERMEAKLRETEKLVATGEMLGSVRHEMGNLINKASTGMQMMTDLYLKGDKDKYNELREKIVDNLISAKAIWKYVDDYRQKSESDEVNSYKLEDMVNAAVSDSSEQLEEWKIKLSLKIDRRITLSGKVSLPDIFKHLVINSCYGMELVETGDKGGILSITARAIPEFNEVEIIQTDTGADLTADIRNRTSMGGELFGEQGKIGGISLFLARRITHDHKGTFDIQSNNGKGTRFIIRLPLDPAKA